MHNYGVPTEVVRLSLVVGIIVSILIYERWRAASGAAVVAGYLSLFISRPLYILTTVVIAVVTYLIVERFIARKMFLYSRKRLVVMVLVGLSLQLITGGIAYLLNLTIYINQATPWLLGLYGVGFVLPGLIAQDIERQGVRITVSTVVAATLLTFVILRIIEAVKINLPIFWNSIGFRNNVIQYSYNTQLLIPAVILSILIGALIFERFGIRSGGFLTAAYIALFVLQPAHLVFILAASFLVYIFVTRVLMHHTPIFGRTKFAMMVLTGVVFTWILEVVVIRATNSAFLPFAGFSVISPMISALIANDGERQGLMKTLLGLSICTITVFILMKSMDLLLLG